MMRRVLTLSAVLVAVSVWAVAGDEKAEKSDQPKPPHPALEKLKQLAGEWTQTGESSTDAEGKVGKKEDEKKDEKKGETAVIYKVVSADSAVMETLFPGTPHEMITMYHLDGPDVLLTHYCAAGNQPRMKLEKSDEPNKLVFKFAGGTNLDPAKDGHMHDLTLTIVDKDHLRADWTWYQDGKKGGTHTFEFQRKKPA